MGSRFVRRADKESNPLDLRTSSAFYVSTLKLTSKKALSKTSKPLGLRWLWEVQLGCWTEEKNGE